MTDIQNVVKNSPKIGFSLILQLTGVNGSRQFDKLTKTKTVESILTSMDDEGIQSYIEYLLEQVDEDPSASVEYVHGHSFFSCIPFRAALIIGLHSSCPVLVSAQRGGGHPGFEHAPRMGH